MEQKVRDTSKKLVFLLGGMVIVCDATTLLAIIANTDNDGDGVHIRVLFIRMLMLGFAFHYASRLQISLTLTLLLWLTTTVSIGSYLYFEVQTKGYLLAIDTFTYIMELGCFGVAYLAHGAQSANNEDTYDAKKEQARLEEALPSNAQAAMMIQSPVVVQSTINTQPLLSTGLLLGH